MRVANFVLLFSLPSQLTAAALRSPPEVAVSLDATSFIQHTQAYALVDAEGDVLDDHGSPLSLDEEDEDVGEADVFGFKEDPTSFIQHTQAVVSVNADGDVFDDSGIPLSLNEDDDDDVTEPDVSAFKGDPTSFIQHTHAVVSVTADGDVLDDYGSPLSLNEEDMDSGEPDVTVSKERVEIQNSELVGSHVSPHDHAASSEKEQKSLLQSTVVFMSDGKLNRERMQSNVSNDEIVVSSAGSVSGDSISETDDEAQRQIDVIDVPQTSSEASLIQTMVSVRSEGDVMLNYGIALSYGDEGDDTDEVFNEPSLETEKVSQDDVLL